MHTEKSKIFVKVLLLVLFICGITACNNSNLVKQGTVSVTLPGSASHRTAVNVDIDTLSYTLKLEGDITYGLSAESGQTVEFPRVFYGEYTLTIDAFGPDQILYYSAKVPVVVESSSTVVEAKLKYVGPKVKEMEDLEIFIISIDDEYSDTKLLEDNELSIIEGDVIRLKAPDNYKYYYWFFQGQPCGSEQCYERETSLNDHGNYIITLIVIDDFGNVYSQDITVIIEMLER